MMNKRDASSGWLFNKDTQSGCDECDGTGVILYEEE